MHAQENVPCKAGRMHGSSVNDLQYLQAVQRLLFLKKKKKGERQSNKKKPKLKQTADLITDNYTTINLFIKTK